MISYNFIVTMRSIASVYFIVTMSQYDILCHYEVYTIINIIVTMRSIGSLTFYVTMRSTVSTIINIIVTMRSI